MPRKKPAAAVTEAGATEVQAPAVKTEKLPHVVTVGCKMHVAAFVLELCEPQRVMEQGLQGQREVTVFNRTGKKKTVAGMAYPVGPVPDGYPPRPQIVAGYALTHDIPGDFWREWVKQHAKAPYVVNKMIVAYPSIADIKAVGTEETKDQMSGLEPVQRRKDGKVDKIVDPRVGKTANVSVEGVAGAR